MAICSSTKQGLARRSLPAAAGSDEQRPCARWAGGASTTIMTLGYDPAKKRYVGTFSIELRSDDHRVLTSRFQDDDGNWHELMTAHYRRTK